MSTNRRALIVALLIGSTTLGLRGTAAEHRAHLSDDLLSHQARLTTSRTRVIVHGDAATLDALASRHHLQILRRLAGGVVVAANSAELTELAADSAIDHLSDDPIVRTSMSVSNQS